MKQSIVTALLCVAASGCDALAGLSETSPNADGTYRGDFQVRVTYAERGPTGSTTHKQRSVAGAVGFTIKGGKVMTTSAAGEGVTIWDGVNKTMWVEFFSIVSSNETFCSRWRYYGGLLESDQFQKGEGTINCVAPAEEFIGWQTYWKVTRQ